MGRKSVLKSFKMFDSVDISTDQTSSKTNVLRLDQASIHLYWTGASPVGVITVEARNGEDDQWYELNLGADPVAVSGNSGDHQILFSEMPFTDLRLQYVSTSGTGSIVATITAKVVGA